MFVLIRSFCTDQNFLRLSELFVRSQVEYFASVQELHKIKNREFVQSISLLYYSTAVQRVAVLEYALQPIGVMRNKKIACACNQSLNYWLTI